MEFQEKMLLRFIDQKTEKKIRESTYFLKSASAGAIIKNWGAVRKCVRNNYKSAGVRAAYSKISRNPTSG